MTTSVDDLHDWNTLSDGGPTLIVDNGLSTNLWSAFRHDSLYGRAEFSAQAQNIFHELDTRCANPFPLGRAPSGRALKTTSARAPGC